MVQRIGYGQGDKGKSFSFNRVDARVPDANQKNMNFVLDDEDSSSFFTCCRCKNPLSRRYDVCSVRNGYDAEGLCCPESLLMYGEERDEESDEKSVIKDEEHIDRVKEKANGIDLTKKMHIPTFSEWVERKKRRGKEITTECKAECKKEKKQCLISRREDQGVLRLYFREQTPYQAVLAVPYNLFRDTLLKTGYKDSTCQWVEGIPDELKGMHFKSLNSACTTLRDTRNGVPKKEMKCSGIGIFVSVFVDKNEYCRAMEFVEKKKHSVDVKGGLLSLDYIRKNGTCNLFIRGMQGLDVEKKREDEMEECMASISRC